MRLCLSCMNDVGDESESFCPHCGANLNDVSVEPQFLQPGTELQEKFVVGRHIGSGGFGHTYIGWNKALLSKVAIKEYYPRQYCERSKDGVTVTPINANYEERYREGLSGFIEEARSIAELRDIKGVVEVYSFFEENGTGYIVMEYLEGMDVKTILKMSGNRREYDWCRRVVLTVLDTLKEVHKRGVLHRDIAPDNIFVTNEGIIKLIDFGASKRVNQGPETQSEILLKSGYAPIEQYSRKSNQGPYTDLYAVAALFYRMLTGQKPAPAPERVKNEHLPAPSELGVEIPKDAELGIMVCLNVRAEYRLQSAEEFMSVLDGDDFEPVYEPEWILPATEAEIREEKESQARASKLSVKAKIAILAACIALMAGGVVLAVFMIQDRTAEVDTSGVVNASDKMVPLTGTRLADLEESLKNGGLSISTDDISITYEYDANETDEIIKTQSIEAGEPVGGNKLDLVVMSSKHVTMPDLTGMDMEDAKKAAEGSGLSPTVTKIGYSTVQPLGKVAEVSPSAGTTVDLTADKKAVLNVSEGTEADWQISLSGIVGKTTDQVRSLLIDRLLKKDGMKAFESDVRSLVNKHVKASSKKRHSESIGSGKVCKVSPGESTSAFNIRDREVTVTISSGPKPKPTKEPEPEPDYDNDNDDGGSSSSDDYWDEIAW